MFPRLHLFTICAALLAATSLAHPEPNKRQVPTPNLTCGRTLGEGINYFCPEDKPCCSYYGFCGTGDAYCNTLAGCQEGWSSPTVPGCHMPIDKVTESPNGKCGRRFEETWGYRCPEGENPCCSSSFFCGSTPEHCDISKGCKPEYGNCNDDA